VQFLQRLKDSRLETLQAWSREAYVGDSIEQGAVMNAKALGGIAVLDNLVETIEGFRVEE